jgi:hypothetical protein
MESGNAPKALTL